jgi:hypothetical protein
LTEIILEILFYGLWKLVKKIYFFLRKTLFGTPIPNNSNQEKRRLEKKFLYKKITLSENLNMKLTKGMKGELVEIINKNSFLAEFRDKKGNPIEFKTELIHKVNKKQFEINKLTTHNTV